MSKFKKTIFIDLDGVLNVYNGKFDKNFIPPIKDGAKEFLEKLNEKYEVKIFTTRNRALTLEWLVENKLSHLALGVTNIKEPCYLFVDDRCLKFNGDYNEILKNIEDFKVWWK